MTRQKIEEQNGKLKEVVLDESKEYINKQAKKTINVLKEGCSNYGELQKRVYKWTKSVIWNNTNEEIYKAIIKNVMELLNEEIAAIELVDSSPEKATEEIYCIKESGAEPLIEELEKLVQLCIKKTGHMLSEEKTEKDLGEIGDYTTILSRLLDVYTSVKITKGHIEYKNKQIKIAPYRIAQSDN